MERDCLNAQEVELSDQRTSSCFHLGVLFIHGIGAQKRGQTLAEFGAPVYVWLKDRLNGLDDRWRGAIEQQAVEAIAQQTLEGIKQQTPEAIKQQTPEAIKQQVLEAIKQQTLEATKQQTPLEQWRKQIEDWATDGFHTEDRRSEAWEPDSGLLTQLAERVKCDTIVGRVGLTDALVDDPADRSAPAHAELRIQRLRIDGSLEMESWLLAESWWAETFIPPGFAELARWGLRIIPWTIGNHFGAHIRRVVARRPRPRTHRSWKQTWRWLVWAASLPMPFSASSLVS